jgi:hypothetical protein
MVGAISGPSGAGKSTLVAKVTAVLRRATALYSHSYERVGTWHPDSCQWVEQGCDPNQWVGIPQLVEDVRALRHGRAIVLPPSPVPCPGTTRCRTALLCYACAVPMEPAAHNCLFPSCPHTRREFTGKMQGKQAGQHTIACSRGELLEEESRTALTRAARSMPHPVDKPSLWRASGSWRYCAATRDGRMVADRAREQWLPSIGTRKRAYRLEGLILVGVPLHFLLSTLLMHMKKHATDRFVRDTIRCCYGAQGFLLLHHTMNDYWPMFSGNTICGVFWPWSAFAHHRRRADVMCFIMGEHVLDLEIQFARWGKEEV